MPVKLFNYLWMLYIDNAINKAFNSSKWRSNYRLVQKQPPDSIVLGKLKTIKR
jgi:hypothetical protein